MPSFVDQTTQRREFFLRFISLWQRTKTAFCLQSRSKLLAHHKFCSSIKSKNPKIHFSLIVPPTACFNSFRVSESLAMPSSIFATKQECVKVKLALSLPSKVIQKQTNVSLRTVQ